MPESGGSLHGAGRLGWLLLGSHIRLLFLVRILAEATLLFMPESEPLS